MDLNLADWLPVYRKICDEFGFDPRKDEEAALMLAKMMGHEVSRALEAVRRRIPSEVVLCGSADSLPRELESVGRDTFVVAADGATTEVIRAGIHPAMIVTDLDGDIDDQVEANRGGATVFIHAHGDNMDALERHVRRFVPPVIGTCQTTPPPGLLNYGGFTDGDRAACICAELGARSILLVGFDFCSPSDKRGRDPGTKRRKLAWAENILGMLSAQGTVIKGFRG